MNQQQNLITVREYADQQGVNVQAIYKRIAKGLIKSVKRNGRTLILLENQKSETEIKPKSDKDIELRFLKEKIEQLETDKNREIERNERLETSLRDKDRLIEAVLTANHREMLEALQSIGTSQVSKLGMQRQLGHFDPPVESPVKATSQEADREPVEAEIQEKGRRKKDKKRRKQEKAKDKVNRKKEKNQKSSKDNKRNKKKKKRRK